MHHHQIETNLHHLEVTMRGVVAVKVLDHPSVAVGVEVEENMFHPVEERYLPNPNDPLMVVVIDGKETMDPDKTIDLIDVMVAATVVMIDVKVTATVAMIDAMVAVTVVTIDGMVVVMVDMIDVTVVVTVGMIVVTEDTIDETTGKMKEVVVTRGEVVEVLEAEDFKIAPHHQIVEVAEVDIKIVTVIHLVVDLVVVLKDGVVVKVEAVVVIAGGLVAVEDQKVVLIKPLVYVQIATEKIVDHLSVNQEVRMKDGQQLHTNLMKSVLLCY